MSNQRELLAMWSDKGQVTGFVARTAEPALDVAVTGGETRQRGADIVANEERVRAVALATDEAVSLPSAQVDERGQGCAEVEPREVCNGVVECRIVGDGDRVLAAEHAV